ncbi:MAG: hypothetical protein ABJP08_29070 [Roseibium sp.]
MKHFDPTNLRHLWSEHIDMKAFKEVQQRQADGLRRQKDQKTKAQQDDDFDDVVITSMASMENIAAFQKRLDALQQENVERILYLQQQRDILMTQQQQQLDNAFVLDNGERVFRSEDATFVVNESGEMISHEIIDPASIGEQHTFAEDYQRTLHSIDVVNADLGDAITFQQRLEALEERSEQSGLTQTDLDALEAELDDIIPDLFKPTNETAPKTMEVSGAVRDVDQIADIGIGLK